MENKWENDRKSVVNLYLDSKNPRLGNEGVNTSSREIIQYLFENDKAVDLAKSIATRGYFENEPLLIVNENGQYIVIEGNRRLAALKALNEPEILEGTSFYKQIDRLSKKIDSSVVFTSIPVTIAPNRLETDKLVAGRHVGTPVLAWTSENRASFILNKLSEGYNVDALRDELGFTLSDIQKAKQTKAIVEMARSLDLTEEENNIIKNPRAKVFTTIERVFESTVGRDYLKIEPDSEHGIKGRTTKNQFVKGFKKLVGDLISGKESSRTLNTNSDIDKYFKKWDKKDLPEEKRGSFTPADIIQDRKTSKQISVDAKSSKTKRSRSQSKSVVPRSLKIRVQNERLIDIRKELTKLKRETYPNAGSILLRVFLELSVVDYLKRKGEYEKLVKELIKKNKLKGDAPDFKQLSSRVIEIAKKKLTSKEAKTVEKALTYNKSAPFTISDLHSFVHNNRDLPGARDIYQFWLRTEPLFKLMLEEDIEENVK